MIGLRTILCFLLLAPWASSQSAVQAWLVDSASDQLLAVDPLSGRASALVSTFNNGLTTPADLSWDEVAGELWTIDFAGGEVGTIDPATGIFTPLFQAHPLSGWQGLAWDPGTSLFYLANQDDNLYTLDPASGQCALLGASGASLITCLDVDGNGDLWGIEFFQGGVVRIDKSSGAASLVATTIPGFQGLGIDPRTGVFFGANSQDLALHEIDPLSGANLAIGVFGAGVSQPKGFDLAGSICEGTLTSSGSGCPDSSATTLLMIAGGLPCLGRALDLGTQFGVFAPYFLIMGISDQSWLGLSLPLDLSLFGAPGCSLYTSQEAVLGPLIPGASLRLDIPRDPGLLGATSFWQGALIDPALSTTLPVATSDLLVVVIG